MTDFVTPTPGDDDAVVHLHQTHIVRTDVVVTEGYTQDGTPVDIIEADLVETDIVEADIVEADVIDRDDAEADAEASPLDEVPLRSDEDRFATQGALPLDVRTGDDGVDAAVGQLRALDELAVTDHPEVFTAVHRALQDALVDLDRT